MSLKKSKTRRKKIGSAKMVFGIIEINGKNIPGISYRRTDYSDGTFKETGLPKGKSLDQVLSEIIANALK